MTLSDNMRSRAATEFGVDTLFANLEILPGDHSRYGYPAWERRKLEDITLLTGAILEHDPNAVDKICDRFVVTADRVGEVAPTQAGFLLNLVQLYRPTES